MHDAIEQAYKNGYEQGAKDFVEKLKPAIAKNSNDAHYRRRSFGKFDVFCIINKVLKEMECEGK